MKNSVIRVVSIMSKAYSKGKEDQDQRALEVWANTFGIEEYTEQDTAFKVTRSLQLLREEIDRAEELAKDTSIEEARYSEAFARIRDTVQPINLAIKWESYQNKFSTTHLEILGLVSDVVPAEHGVDRISLNAFQEALGDFEDHIVTLNEGVLRDFAVRQAAHMEQAIADYPVIGARAFEQGMKDFAGEGFFNYSVWQENEGTETIERMRNLGGKLFDIIKYTAPAIQAAAGMKELLGL